MKYNIYSIVAAATLLSGLTACEKESNFLLREDEGQLNTGSLNVDYINSGRETRAGGVNVGDFTVNFVTTTTNEIAKSYKYSEMPEVVALPAGSYKAMAEYGDNPIADWEKPYYLGDSEFEIVKGKITDDVPPVECELSNIRIKVNVSDLGLGLLGNDAKVVVEAGKEGSLTYTQNETRAGYFRFDGANTIIATFSGTVDGVYVENVRRIYDNVDAGNAYTINFTVNKPDNVEPGDIEINDISIDATINIQDQNIEIDPNEPDDNILTDDMRPDEDPITPPDDPVVNPDDPNNPDNPDNPDDPTPPAEEGPKIVLLSDGLVLNECCVVSECAFDVTSETGIKAFDIHIESPNLTPEELGNIGLAQDIDLVNPGAMADGLAGLGFPVNVGGMKKCHFDITEFLPLLQGFGEAEHKFHLTITDDSGTTTCFIGLKIVL